MWKAMRSVQTGSPIRFPPKNLQLQSQEAARIFLESQGFVGLKFEAEGRVDVIAISRRQGEFRIEVKLISSLNESKGRVLRAIRETRRRLESKKLTHLLFLTLLRRKETDDEHFIKIKEYCLVGIFVSKSELEKKKENELVKAVGEEIERYMEGEIDLIGMNKAEFRESWRLEEERQKLLDGLEAGVKSLENSFETLKEQILGFQDNTLQIEEKVDQIEEKVDQIEEKVDQIEEKVGQIEEKVEQKVDQIEEKVTELSHQIKGLERQLSENQEQLREFLAYLSKKLDQ
ncbi:MAG: hypothetical protein D6732_21060 [Methanobacteriota archaeon]|nr:MAG: hypothetical protein D6732_21060 [Euryarchaeota archaeon]